MGIARRLFQVAVIATFLTGLAVGIPSCASMPTPLSLAVIDAAVLKITQSAGHGTGVSIGDGRILTAAHVVEGVTSVGVRSRDGEVGKAEVVARDDTLDLAILRWEHARALPALGIDCAPPRMDEPLRVVGHPLEWEWVHRIGRIASTQRGNFVAQSIALEMDLLPGMSGGPILSPAGRVRAVAIAISLWTVRGRGVPTGLSVGMPSEVICKWLDNLDNEGELE